MSMIINADLEYLRHRLNIPEVRLATYESKSIDEILKAEAAAGNQEAIQMAADMFTDVNQLIELFQLAEPENKLVIIKQMNQRIRQLAPLHLSIESIRQSILQRAFNHTVFQRIKGNIRIYESAAPR